MITKKKGKAKIVVPLFILGIFTVLALVACIVFLVLNISTGSFAIEKPQGALLQDTHEKAFFVKIQQYPFDKTAQQQTDFINNTVALASENGFNTIYLEANQYKNSLFSGRGFNFLTGEEDIDPLQKFADACKQHNIALFVVIDPFMQDVDNLDKFVTESDLVFVDGNDYATVSNEKYFDTVKASVVNVVKAYSVTGVIYKMPVVTSQNSQLIQSYQNLITATSKLSREVGVLTSIDNSYILNQPKDEILFSDFVVVENAASFSQVLDMGVSDNLKIVPLIDTIDKVTTATDMFFYSDNSLFKGLALSAIPSEITIQDFSLVTTAFDELDDIPVFDAQINQSLKITYPTASDKIYTSKCFILGNSDPNLPLYLDGEEIHRTTTKGSFGVLVDLSMGSNSFDFSQGETTHTLNITRSSYSWGGGGSSAKHDGTVKAPIGQTVMVTPWIAGTISNPNSDDSTNRTLGMGGTVVVTDNVLTTRSGKTTYAYKLASGDYILANKVKFVNDGLNEFNEIKITKETGGEYFELLGNGTPVPTVSFEKTKLSLTFHNTKITANVMPQSGIYSSCDIQNFDDYATVTLSFDPQNPLWGYQVEYLENGGVRVFLKAKPQINLNSDKPLQGLTVLLDPGHGDQDRGAPGIGGLDGKNEKDFNLAIGLATNYRLKQLGATVVMTRTDDTFLSLEQRSQLAFETKPDFYLSIHHNSIELVKDVNEIQRIECYYFEDNSKDFAQNLLDNVAKATGRETRDAMWTYFYVNRMTVCPSVLFEYGFMVNPQEYELCADNQTIWNEAFANAQAIIDTISSY